mmetsp:Transcript_11431/g.13105  ORF Transcript_11431/g.13105 Transcript_11431/m.13105 type:complete len:406 (+) Transcript_11431:75-1292(+)
MLFYRLLTQLFEMTWVQIESSDDEKRKSWVWFPSSKYSDLKYLASGGFGEIYSATTTGVDGIKKTVALKKIPYQRKRRTQRLYLMLRNLAGKGEDEVLPTLKEVEKELELLSRAQGNQFVLGLLDSFRQKTCLWIVTEYAKYRDLRGIVQSSNLLEINDFDTGERLFRPVQKSLPINIILHLMAPIFDAVRYLHSRGIVHRDIKEENILLTESGIPKLADLGGARTFGTLPIEYDSDYTGTEYYVAPEAIRKESYTTAVDSWALGVTMLSLYYCGWPFTHKWNYVFKFLNTGFYAREDSSLKNGQKAMYKMIRTGPYRKKKNPSKEWIEYDKIILGLMMYEQQKRMTVTNLCKSNEVLKSRIKSWNIAVENGSGIVDTIPENENFNSCGDFTLKMLEEAFNEAIQ